MDEVMDEATFAKYSVASLLPPLRTCPAPPPREASRQRAPKQPRHNEPTGADAEPRMLQLERELQRLRSEVAALRGGSGAVSEHPSHSRLVQVTAEECDGWLPIPWVPVQQIRGYMRVQQNSGSRRTVTGAATVGRSVGGRSVDDQSAEWEGVRPIFFSDAPGRPSAGVDAPSKPSAGDRPRCAPVGGKQRPPRVVEGGQAGAAEADGFTECVSAEPFESSREVGGVPNREAGGPNCEAGSLHDPRGGQSREMEIEIDNEMHRELCTELPDSCSDSELPHDKPAAKPAAKPSAPARRRSAAQREIEKRDQLAVQQADTLRTVALLAGLPPSSQQLVQSRGGQSRGAEAAATKAPVGPAQPEPSASSLAAASVAPAVRTAAVAAAPQSDAPASSLSIEEHREWLRLERTIGAPAALAPAALAPAASAALSQREGDGAVEDVRARWRWLDARVSDEQGRYKEHVRQRALAEVPSRYTAIEAAVEAAVDARLRARAQQAVRCYPQRFTKLSTIKVPRKKKRAEPECIEPSSTEPSVESVEMSSRPIMQPSTELLHRARLFTGAPPPLWGDLPEVPYALDTAASARASPPRPPVSADATASMLARQVGADAVLSSSTFATLIDCLSTNMGSTLEIPLSVRAAANTIANTANTTVSTTANTKIIYLDKPLCPPLLSAREKGARHCRAELRAALEREHNAAACEIGAERDRRSVRNGDNAVSAAAGAAAGARCTYEHLELGGLQLLVRCKHDARISGVESVLDAEAAAANGAAANGAASEAAELCSLKVSLEYVSGKWEHVTSSEHARWWSQLALRPGAALLVGWMSAPTDRDDFGGRPPSLIKQQLFRRTAELNGLSAWNAPNDFKPDEALDCLSTLLRELSELPAGSYLLRRAPGMANTLTLWRSGESLLHALAPSATTKRFQASYDLHEAQQKAGALDTKKVTYVPHQWDADQESAKPSCGGRIPYTFEPRQNESMRNGP